MRRAILVWVGVFFIVAGVHASSRQSTKPVNSSVLGTDQGYRQVLDRYCVSCHNEKLNTAGLNLNGINIQDAAHDPARWEKVLLKLRSGAMPPPGRTRPDKGDTSRLTSYLETSLESGADVYAVNAKGQTALHGAAFTGADSIVQLLAEHAAKLDAKDKSGKTPLAIADGEPVDGVFGAVNHQSTAGLLRKMGASLGR